MTSSATDIHVTDTAITAVLVGGDWLGVSGVLISFADYTASHPSGPTTVTAHGLHLSALITSGPGNGQRLVAPLGDVQAIRVAP